MQNLATTKAYALSDSKMANNYEHSNKRQRTDDGSRVSNFTL